MNEDMAEIYHYLCVVCDQTFSRDEVREVRDGKCVTYICDGCRSDEINADVKGE